MFAVRKDKTMTIGGAGPSRAPSHQQGVGPSRAPGHQPVGGTSAAQAPLQKVKPGIWASPAGTSTLAHEATNPRKRARTLITAIAESKRDRGALHEKLADAFRKADFDVREAMRANPRYHNIIQNWARDLVRDAWDAPRTTIHRGDQAMRELHRVAKDLPSELAADLFVAAAPWFVGCSKYIVRHDKDKPAIFSSLDLVPVSKTSPDVEASKSSPDVEASKQNPDIEASKLNPDVEPSKPSPDPKASVPKYEKYTYLDDLTAWIGRAEVPNPRQDEAIRQLEALVDKS